MNDTLRIASLKIALQRAFLGRAILRVIEKNIHSLLPGDVSHHHLDFHLHKKEFC